MAPAKTAARSRRTHSYSWSSDSSALRPVYQWPDHESTSSGRTTSGDDLSDGAERKAQLYRTSPSGARAAKDVQGATRMRPTDATHLAKKTNYDSDTCLTPRSRRTLRRTLSGDTEPWPSVKAPPKPALDTIYSPTHEILHPMQSLLLQKSLSSVPNTSLRSIPAPARRTLSVEILSRRRDADVPPTAATPNLPKVEREPQLREEEEGGLLKTEQDENEEERIAVPDRKAVAATSNVVVIIVDAEKKLTKFTALDWAITVAVQPGDEIVVLGVLKHVFSPLGYKVVANTDPLVGANQEVLQSEVKKTTEVFEQRLLDSGRRAECEKKNVKLTVRIAPGARARMVVVRELTALKATYAVFDRRLRRGTRFYGKHLSCHAVRMRSNGRSTKTIFSMATSSPHKTLANSPSMSTASSSPTSDTSSSATSPSLSPTYFWRRFTPFRSSRNSRTATTNPEATVSPSKAIPVGSLNLDSFMSEMQDFSMSLDRSQALDGLGKDSQVPKLALQSCVVADAYSYKHGMDSHRIKHRPMSVSIPICAT